MPRAWHITPSPLPSRLRVISCHVPATTTCGSRTLEEKNATHSWSLFSVSIFFSFFPYWHWASFISRKRGSKKVGKEKGYFVPFCFPCSTEGENTFPTRLSTSTIYLNNNKVIYRSLSRYGTRSPPPPLPLIPPW